jgi:hypothetical protein
MITKWTQLLAFDAQLADQCDWRLFFRSLTGHLPHKQIQIIKYNARLLPVGTNLKRRRHAESSLCINCNEDEDHNHIIQCTHPEMEKAFVGALKNIYGWLITQTSVPIAEDIIRIAEIFRKTPLEIDTSIEPTSRLGVQIRLGQRAFFAGLWTIQWRQDHEHYLRETHSRKDSEKWMGYIINKVQSIPLIMWEARNALRSKTVNHLEKFRILNDLNNDIDLIFNQKPHDRMMAHCDSSYFRKHSREQLKALKLHKKINWITGARLILAKYERIGTTQAAQFTSYFQWDRG